MSMTPATDPRTLTATRVAKAVVLARDGMEEGRIWVEAYLPFDAASYAAFTRKALELGGGPDGYRQAAAQDPELATKALTPIDAHGEAMLPEDLQALADSYLVESRKIDVMHDQQARQGVHVVGSFVNGPEIASPHFWPGSWVLVLKLEPWTPEFLAVKAGTLNAVSFQAVVKKIPVVPVAPTFQE